jgi:hypothetical protein
MLRFKPENQSAWEDIALNIGKLSLAGLFVTGTVYFCNAYAESPVIARSAFTFQLEWINPVFSSFLTSLS